MTPHNQVFIAAIKRVGIIVFVIALLWIAAFFPLIWGQFT